MESRLVTMPPKSHRDAVEAYAPVFAQKVSNEWLAADSIAPVDFAGSLGNVADNVKKLFEDTPHDQQIENPKVYYSVCETTTHLFIVYAVYHVFDWWKRDTPKNLYDLIRDRYDEHAHDMEGALVIVRKEPKLELDGLVTVSHQDFFLYTQPRIPTGVGSSKAVPAGRALRIVKFNETVDGNIWLDQASGRIKLYIQSRGHGIRGDHGGWGGGDGVWYYVPEGVGGDPGELNDEENDTVPYQLEDINAAGGLWAHRFKRRVFQQRDDGRWGFVCWSKLTHGKRVPASANPPWSWNDHNDPSPIGEIATDPARFIVRYAQGWGPVSQQYIYNPYQAIRPTHAP